MLMFTLYLDISSEWIMILTENMTITLHLRRQIVPGFRSKASVKSKAK